MSLRFRLDPPQLRQQLARGSKPLRGEHPTATVARAAEPPAVDLSSPAGHLLEALRPRGDRHAPQTRTAGDHDVSFCIERVLRRGLDASLDQIAAHAGVGVGTVYRRFPDKDTLIDALFEERIDEIAAAAQHALSAPDPWEGLVGFLHQENALLASDRGLRQVLRSRGAHKTERAREKIVPIATELVARAQQAGSLRADLDVFDLPVLDLMVSAIADMTREVSPELWQRALTIIIDGLATTRQTPTPLPGKPLDRDQLAAAAAIFKHGRP